ncbi:hypothetical protein CCACVL1_00350 [Corchorus capsularis]|uniref:Ephrin RBD domain-containing protein n=1 Tax=Corchorus capsularis TaxID=210143 RepID=A0A1R3KXB2_COCAP|nr:hypothetical protein CCACVL1_00350 [Corchorus capsularis]
MANGQPGDKDEPLIYVFQFQDFSPTIW